MAILPGDISKLAAQLAQFSTGELKELCNATSDEKYDQLVGDTERVKSLEQERQVLMASVASLAEYNLSRQEDFERDKHRLYELVQEASKLHNELEAKARQLLQVSQRTSLEATLQRVLEAATQAEEDSETVAKAYLASQLEYAQFLDEYTQKRKLAHERRIRADKLRLETTETWTDSAGVIHDFGGSHYISIDNFTFGRPTKVLYLDASRARAASWDDALAAADTLYRRLNHNLVTNNCHRHVADVLNHMKYDNRSNWSQFDVFLLTLRASYVSLGGFLKQWGAFLVLLAVVLVLLATAA